ncbi:MAG: pyrroline-5-carboxylate reductase [Pseudomonadota bacterium]|nr:pyrroline-5-carboxylate reductase [Pseudomonadota bacterium]
MPISNKIILVGCGKMGGAMLRGWLATGLSAYDVRVVEPFLEAAVALRSELSVPVVSSAEELEDGCNPDVVVFAVKPQGMEEIVRPYAGPLTETAVVLSIAAGRNIEFFERHLGEGVAIVRTMPNTPAAVGRGITAACANVNVKTDQRAVCQALLEAMGEVVWLEDEALIDSVTAVSGSGPAYVFLLIECLARAGEAQGLPPETAEKLARATVAGSGELAQLSDETAGELRVNVTSPGGTTAAALEVLMSDDGLDALMRRAVAAATKRARELAG